MYHRKKTVCHVDMARHQWHDIKKMSLWDLWYFKHNCTDLSDMSWAKVSWQIGCHNFPRFYFIQQQRKNERETSKNQGKNSRSVPVVNSRIWGFEDGFLIVVYGGMISCLCSRGINPSKGMILRVIQCNFPPTSKQPHRNLGWLFGPTLPKHHPQYKRQRRNKSILSCLMAGSAFIYTYLCYLEDMPRAVKVFDPDRSGHLFR